MRTQPLVLTALFFAASLPRAWSQTAADQAAPTLPAQPAATAAGADQAAAPAGPVVTIKDTEPAHGTATKGKDSTGRDTLSVDFPDEDIRNILRNVADLFELNLVIPETLQGKASIKLRDVTWRQIFQNVLQPVGYTYIEDGNIIKIVSNESLAQEPVSTEVFIINYARAADIQPTISSLVDSAAGGKIVVDARSNSLVITERPSRMNRIRPIIEQLDRATDQVMIESKFVEVSSGDTRNLGLNWSTLRNYKVGVTPAGDFSRTRDQTGSNGSNSSNGTTGDNSVKGTTDLANGSTNTSTNTSTNGTLSNNSSTGTTASIANDLASAANTATSSALNLLSSITNNDGTSRTSTAVFSADQFGVVLSALNELNSTKVVSNPTIVTLNNTEATINVGEEDPIPNYSYNEQRGSFEVSGFAYKPIGIILKVTPQVNARGFIKLTLAPEVSQTLRQVSFGGASGATIPVIASRKATTQVSLKDGYTMGIGGLMTRQAVKGTAKIPVLGDIPVLGYLFKHKTNDEQTTNLLIFITAKSISAQGAPTEQIFDSRQVRDAGMTREDLPGYRDGSDPFVASRKAGNGNASAPPPDSQKKSFFHLTHGSDGSK